MKRTHKTLMNKLKRMAAEGQAALYERIGIAVKLWSDQSWVAEYTAATGSASKARRNFVHDYFGEFAGQVGIDAVVEAYERYEESVWEEHSYNPVRVVLLLRAETGTARKKPGRVTKAQLAELQDRIDELEKKNAALTEENGRLRDELQVAQNEIDVSHTKIARLEGQLEVLRDPCVATSR